MAPSRERKKPPGHVHPLNRPSKSQDRAAMTREQARRSLDGVNIFQMFQNARANREHTILPLPQLAPKLSTPGLLPLERTQLGSSPPHEGAIRAMQQRCHEVEELVKDLQSLSLGNESRHAGSQELEEHGKSMDANNGENTISDLAGVLVRLEEGKQRVLSQHFKSKWKSLRSITGSKRDLDEYDEDNFIDGDDHGPAPQRAFGTTEILEHILSYLPASELLLSLSTCHAFKNCYQNSRTLKLKTFEVPSLTVPGMAIYADMPAGSTFAIAGNIGTVTLAPGTTFSTTTTGTVTAAPNTSVIATNSGSSSSVAPMLSSPASEIKVVVDDMNQLLLEQAVTRRFDPRRMMFKFKGAKGIHHARLICNPGEEYTFEIQFENHRISNSWQQPHTGSWTKLYLMDVASGLRLKVVVIDRKIFSRENTRAHDEERAVSKTAAATVSVPAMPVGEIIARARQINTILVAHLAQLPANTDDLMKAVGGSLKEGEKIACTVDTTVRQKQLC